MFNGLHYNSISTVLKEQFGRKTVKISIDGGFTCPNRDGHCGFGGCSFCSDSGSGDFAGTIEEQLASIPAKWTEDGKQPAIIAYYQSHSNTYAPAAYLRKLWTDTISDPRISGLAIATRPDCIDDEIAELLAEFSKKTYLWVELGLQTESEQTAENFGRGYKNAVFEDAMNKLSTRGIKCVVHLILGLPGEDKEQHLRTAEYVAGFKPFGIKIHMLHLVKNSLMGKDYIKHPWPVMDKDEYIGTVCDMLELMPQSITVHRLTGDAPKDQLIAPLWTSDKHAVLNGIQQEFKRRGSYQGIKAGL